ncbi:threonine/homoserine exporter RhtA [Serratia microhaemolytica]|uniref:threonine/homoserine exporter RhtA n=1 Tax=Serratia microhaemolytica TaxID=2675110 RepID=UPI000FDF417A|nr:threonine/homoserine exporter RhtA [Serratia microhaemolytica]
MRAPATSTSVSSIFIPVLLLVIAMISVQSGASLAKTLFPLIGPEGITTLRLALGTLILAAIFRPWKIRFSAKHRLPLLIYGLSLGGMNYLFYLSLNTIPLGIAVAFEFTGPLAVAMFASRRLVDFVWIALAVIGLWFLLPIGTAVDQVDPLGSVYALGAGVCWGIYILSGRKAGVDLGTGTVAIGTLIAALVFCPLGAWQTGSALLDINLLPLGLAVAILSTAIPYSCEIIALSNIPTRTFGTLVSMEPAFAALSGMVFLGEHLSLLQWLALIAIMTASVGATLTIKPKSKLENISQ